MRIGILWDLDGTLLDTLEDLKDSVNYALKTFGYPPRTKEEIRKFVGNGAKRLIASAVPEGADWEPVLACFRAYYETHAQIKTAPYAGISEALENLKNRFPMAIVSNKPDEAVKKLCDNWFPGLYACGERQGVPRKPAPDMIVQAMAAIGADTCVYVGDSEVDVLTAQNANVPCLSVLWGFRGREELTKYGAVHFCDRPEALADCIQEVAYGK